jgi:sulfide dehydrogenase cytochrome subunit
MLAQGIEGPGRLALKLKLACAGVVTAGFFLPAAAQQGTPPRFAPANLSPEGVRALAANCASCHGLQGRPAKGSEVTPLAGRPAAELEGMLSAFKRGERPGTVMPQLAKGYGDDEIAALAAYFSKAAP